MEIMSNEAKRSTSDTTQPSVDAATSGAANRRSFLKNTIVAGAAATVGAGLLARSTPAFGQEANASSVTAGDIALLRFAAAAELIEADLWQQYAELGGLSFGRQNSYQRALQQLDSDGSQYVQSNSNDEASHAAFLNAYLESLGAEPVDFDAFRTLPSSQAEGALQIGRLTDIMDLTVDTSWYTRYRSATNPDFGANFPQAINLVNLPGIPRNNDDFGPAKHIQAIANTAAFHFGMIEQTGTSLYPVLAQKARNAEVLKILLSIGGDEVMHFLEWVDFAGNAVQPPIAPLTDPTNGLTFPNFNATGNPQLQTNLIFGIATEFISPRLPLCSVIRPTNTKGFAVGVVQALTNSGHFIGQSPLFFKTFMRIAEQADAAQRGI
jgi:hypothetical protein